MVIDATAGAVFRGAAAAESAARAAVLHLAATLSPERWSITVHVAPTSASWSWVTGLPHRAAMAASHSGVTFIEFAVPRDSPVRVQSNPDSAVRIAVVRAGERNPPRILHAVDAGTGALRLRSPGQQDVAIRGEFATLGEADSMAAFLRRAAHEAGLVPSSDRLPDSVAFSTLPRDSGDPRALSCSLGRGSDGIWTVDLVSEGPHAVVGGTTGSGKSELLASWMLALARRYSPQQVNLLLVDFKGGATFGPLAKLPHSVGLITDLDDRQARRALESLRAELLYRERTLADAGARAIELLPPEVTLPRLVIVVDEFAAVTGGLPDLHGLFVDLAARGRSLGVHLVLCTQRPASTLRESILANCTLRISLRVNDAADSIAVIGTGDAAGLPRRIAGRALVSVGGDAPAAVQVAIADAADVAAAVAAPAPAIRRPWCEPLPARLTWQELTARVPAPGARPPFGLVDLPSLQRQEAALWEPAEHGHVLVLGGYASGRSTAVEALVRSAGSTVLLDDVEAVWDAVTSTLRRLRDRRSGPRVLGIDDVDSLVAGAQSGVRRGARVGAARGAARRRVRGAVRARRAVGAAGGGRSVRQPPHPPAHRPRGARRSRGSLDRLRRPDASGRRVLAW